MFAEQNLKCQNCEAPVVAADELCGECGAKLLHRRVFLGVPKPENFILTAEENKPDVEEDVERDDWQFQTGLSRQVRDASTADGRTDAGRALGRFFPPRHRPDHRLVRYIFAIVNHGGYGVRGLQSRHRRPWTGHHKRNVAALFAILTLGSLGLTAAYFIVMHGLGGQTIGKMLLGLRVVDVERDPPSFRQAALRWLAAVGFAPIGLGLLWVLWQSEKRAWHDFVARTWVVRE